MSPATVQLLGCSEPNLIESNRFCMVNRPSPVNLTDLEESVAGVKFKQDAANAPDIARMRPARLCNTYNTWNSPKSASSNLIVVDHRGYVNER